MRGLISLALVALLTLTSQAMAVARGASAAADQMVLCIGADAVVVYVDAEGQPTAAPHFCPDCVLLGADTAGAPTLVLIAADWAAYFAGRAGDQTPPMQLLMAPNPRAPPHPV